MAAVVTFPSPSKSQQISLIIFLSTGLIVVANTMLCMITPLDSSQSSNFRRSGVFTLSPHDPFAPFVDIEFTKSTFDHSKTLHSSVKCANSVQYAGATEADRAHKEIMSRSCKYSNLFYRPSDKTFHYFPGPKENDLYTLLSEEKNDTISVVKEFKQKMSVSMDQSISTGSLENTAVKFHAAAKWSPIIHFGENPPESLSYSIAATGNRQDLVFTMYRTFYGFNLGHFIWDEMLPQFNLLDIFDLVGKQTRHVPFFVELPSRIDEWYRCHPNFRPRFDDCVKMYHKWFPPLLNVLTDQATGDILRTGNWLQGKDAVGMGLNNVPADNATTEEKWANTKKTRAFPGRNYNTLMPNTSWVVLPTALAGIGRLNYAACFADCTAGRSAQRYRFRNFVLENILGTNRFTEINDKTPQTYITFSLPGGSSRPGEVSFFENFIFAARERYGANRIRVEDMANLSFKEQAELTMDTAVYVSNHGGGSSSSIFLPKGSSVLLYHTPNLKRDRIYYETLSYLQTVWVPLEDRNNTMKLMGVVEAALETTSGFYPDFSM